MAAPLKRAGIREVDALHKRARRQLALGRIEAEDFSKLDRTIASLKHIILDMQERSGDGETISNPPDQQD